MLRYCIDIRESTKLLKEIPLSLIIMLSSNESMASRDEFCALYGYDNCEAVTLKLKPIYWVQQEFKNLFETDFCAYCDKRDIKYLLVAEYGEHGNYHWHGIMIFPFDRQRRLFVNWFNKYFGKFHTSDKGDANGWYTYVMKGCKLPQYIDGCAGELQKPLYLFDSKYEVKVT